MVLALVLEYLRLQVFDSLFLFLDCRSVRFGDSQQPLVLLDELLHARVEEVLSEVLRHLHDISSRPQVRLALSKHLSRGSE